MNYVSWLWRNSRGIRWNTALQIVAGTGQVVLGLLMVWLSKQFIDVTIREGTADGDFRGQVNGIKPQRKISAWRLSG